MAWCPTDPAILLVGCANKRVVQYDVRAGTAVLEYNYHLGAVNTVTFIDDGRRIATTSDDRKVLVWEYGTPVPFAYHTDDTMFSITAAALHPDGDAWAGQSMDNQIVVYHARDRTGLNRRKHFSGHIAAGYACQVGFSPNGAYIVSGDGDGQVWVWDWKTSKVVKKFRAHDAGGPTIGVAWHPLHASMMATCGWDGGLKLWE